MYLFVLLVETLKLRVHFQRAVNGNALVLLKGDHLRETVHIGVGQIHHPAHIPDHAFRRHRTESDDLHHSIAAIFSTNIVNHFLPSLKAEVHVDIRHGNALRIQKPLKEQIVLDGINIGDFQTVGHNASRRRTPARPHRDPVLPAEIDIIPHDQKIVNETHIFDRVKLIVQTLLQRAVILRVTLLHPVLTELVQITP